MAEGGKTVRLALVGAGGIAEAHLRAYQRIKEVEPDKFEIVAVCDPVLDRARQFATAISNFQGSQPRAYSDHEALLKGERGNLDAVDITTPHYLHHVTAIACLEEGLHVLVEKPIGLTIKATKAIIATANKVQRIAATAENVRRGVPQRTAKWLFSDNRLIGDPTLFYAVHCSYHPPAPPGREPVWHWRVEKSYSGGGIALDSGAHFCDTLRYFFGDVRQVHAVVRQLLPRFFKKDTQLIPDEREDTWMAILEFETGLLGFWSYTTSAPAHSFTHVVFYATEGALIDTGDVFHGPFAGAFVQRKDGRIRRLSDITRDYRAYLGDDGWQRLFPYNITETFTLECYDFLDAVQKGRQPEVTAVDGLQAKAIAIAIYESSQTGRTVKIADVLSGEIEVYQKPLNEMWNL